MGQAPKFVVELKRLVKAPYIYCYCWVFQKFHFIIQNIKNLKLYSYPTIKGNQLYILIIYELISNLIHLRDKSFDDKIAFHAPAYRRLGALSVTLVRTSIRTYVHTSQEWFLFNNF